MEQTVEDRRGEDRVPSLIFHSAGANQAAHELEQAIHAHVLVRIEQRSERSNVALEWLFRLLSLAMICSEF
jgi:hypothetical protein